MQNRTVGYAKRRHECRRGTQECARHASFRGNQQLLLKLAIDLECEAG
jgi:hypothetical protein